MPHQDPIGHTGPAAHHQDLRIVLDWLLAHADFSATHFRDLCTWTPRSLTAAALLWAWSGETALAERFVAARKIVIRAFGRGERTATTDQASLKTVRAWTATLLVPLVAALRRRRQDDPADRSRVGDFVVFGVDGSRLERPRTKSNQACFAPASRRPATKKSPPKRRRRARAGARADAARATKANGPQLWLTLMWHVGTGLPWDWRTGPPDSSERDHLRQMIAAVPAEALVTADAGSVGYASRKASLDSERHLLIRVGANVRLLKGLGSARERAGRVYLRPDRAAARRQPPLVLRLVVASGPRHPVSLVTSVLDEEASSDQRVIQVSARRRGVELFYRHFKPTFGRRKLRSHRGEDAELEAVWSLVGLWALGRHGPVELAPDAIPASGVRVAGLLRAYRAALREYRSAPEPGESLWERPSVAVIDGYQRRNKASRDDPRKKHEHAIGVPEIRHATALEIEAARQIKDNHPTRLTA